MSTEITKLEHLSNKQTLRLETATSNPDNGPIRLTEDQNTSTTSGIDNKTQIKFKEKKLEELIKEQNNLYNKQKLLYNKSNTKKIEKIAGNVSLALGAGFGILSGIACKSIPAAIFFGVPAMTVLCGLSILGTTCLAKYRQKNPEQIKSPTEQEVMTQIAETQERIKSVNIEIDTLKAELEELIINY